MIIHSPCIITARLLPGVKVEDSFISIEYAGWSPDGRRVYKLYVDTPDFEYVDETVCSGVGGGTLQDGLRAFLSFAAACAESVYCEDRTGKEGENADLFSTRQMCEWCADNMNELSMLSIELEEDPHLIEE